MGGGTDETGLLLRYQNASSFYRVTADLANDTAVLYKEPVGVLVSANYTFEELTMYKFKIDMKGDTFTVYVMARKYWNTQIKALLYSTVRLVYALTAVNLTLMIL